MRRNCGASVLVRPTDEVERVYAEGDGVCLTIQAERQGESSYEYDVHMTAEEVVWLVLGVDPKTLEAAISNLNQHNKGQLPKLFQTLAKGLMPTVVAAPSNKVS